jgi:hypothetical protein
MPSLSDFISSDVQDNLKMLFAAGSVAVTMYFWFVRINRERVSLKVYPISGFEGALEDCGLGIWSGRVFLANCSIMPTAVVTVKAELWWEERWLAGQVGGQAGSELPWNLPPTQVFPRDLTAAFELGPRATREQVYANQRLRFTFVTIEGRRFTEEFQTGCLQAAAAA